MASANVELVRSIFAAWQRGDFSADDWAHPDIEFVYADGPSPCTFKGVENMAEGFSDFVSAWQDYRVVVDEYRDLDDGRVLALTHRSGRGKVSGLELERLGTNGAAIFEIKDGKVLQQVMYLDVQRAFADLGLPPEAD
jgi:ketosteroid isomerase-like protein